MGLFDFLKHNDEGCADCRANRKATETGFGFATDIKDQAEFSKYRVEDYYASVPSLHDYITSGSRTEPVHATKACSDCGGIYEIPKMKTQHQVHIRTFLNEVTQENSIVQVWADIAYFCEFCEPHGEVTLYLNHSDDYGADDYVSFDVTNGGFFQEIDDQDGTMRFAISDERFTEVTCDNCGSDLASKKCTSGVCK